MKVLYDIGKIDPWRLTIRLHDPRLINLSEEETRHLRAAQLGAIFALTPTMLIVNLVNVVIIFAIFLGHGHNLFVTIWAAAMLWVLGPWYMNWRGKSRFPPRDGVSARGVSRVTVNAFILGALWVTPIVYLSKGASEPQHVLLAALACGMTSGGALVLATVWQAALIYTLVVMIPAVGCVISLGGPIYWLLAVMTVSFTYLIARAVYKQADLFVDSHFANSQIRAQNHIIGLLLKDFEEGASDFLWETDAQERLTRVSTRFAELVGEAVDQLEGRKFVDLLLALSSGPRKDALMFASFLQTREPFRDHIVALRIGGDLRKWSMAGKPVFDAHGEFRGFRGVGSDVTDAERLANYDLLTGLPNRSQFEREAQKVMARLKSASRPFAVMTLDLDRFKRVNDSLGHAVGDALLKAVAARISQRLRDGDLVTRFGGDEYVLLCEGDASGRLRALCQSLIEDICRPFDIGDFQVMVGASIGVALSPNDGDKFEELLKASDLALYRAKSEGRGAYCFFDTSLDQTMQERRQLEGDLRQALVDGQLSLNYQPLMDTRTGLVTACEALMRWNHPTRGEVSPDIFIPLAEETGLIRSLGEWAMTQACREATLWPRGLGVAVNVSAVQFRLGGLEKMIASALAKSGLAPERLEVEITESVFIENKSETRETLRSIHDLGVRISLDDFGTGYSSLSYLCSFSFDKIKIDKSFVREMENSESGVAVVRAVAALAHALGVGVTAEGVETEDQLTRLVSLGCDGAQGYLFSRPLSALDVGVVLTGSTAGTANGQSGAFAGRREVRRA
jgi:diguanylate cyclase (GGDEF)-like protein/PAS domain S-box-containing protein